MNKYIDAEKLKAEINNRIMSVNLEELGNFGCHRVWAYNDVKDIVSSLQQEQPVVDLEREIIKYKVPFSDEREYLNEDTLDAIAKHFYEFGKSRKEE